MSMGARFVAVLRDLGGGLDAGETRAADDDLRGVVAGGVAGRLLSLVVDLAGVVEALSVGRAL